MNKKKFPLRWIYYISHRFNSVDMRGRSAVTSRLATLGIAFGVMALIAIMSVMNGFQMEFIDAIMEISSYHLQCRNVENVDSFSSWCRDNELVKTVYPMYETQGLLVENARGNESASLVRAVPSDVLDYDTGLKKEIHMIQGTFDLSMVDSIVLGYDLAIALKAHAGSIVNIMAASGSSSSALFSADRNFIVTGIFYADYPDINAAYSFISLDAEKKYFGDALKPVVAVKLADSNADAVVKARIVKQFPETDVVSWREYNRTFFGALRVEKNVLMFLVILIFLVVAVNIYNAMRRMIYERRQDIAVLISIGASKKDMLSVFSIKGLVTGLAGSCTGLVLGVLISLHMDSVFRFLAKLQYWGELTAARLFNPANLPFVAENSMFSVYAAIPARMQSGEIAAIFLFGVLSAFLSSLIASRQIIVLKPVDILHDE